MKIEKKSLERLQKDNITNIKNQNEIDIYFGFSNPASKKRHTRFLIIELYNFLVIIIALFVFPLTVVQRILWISMFTGILILSFLLFRNKKSFYRFLCYIVDIFGLVLVIFIPYYSNFSLETIEIGDVVTISLLVITIIIDAIFLLNYITIEQSRHRFLSPIVRDNKMRNFAHMGQDNWEDT